MVSFQCESCGDVLTKKKLDPHRNRCRGATFTCIDCMVHFYGNEYRSHTSCMTEEQKYQGALYKNKKAKTASNSTPSAAQNMAYRAYVEDEWEDAPLPAVPDPPAGGMGDADFNVFDFIENPTPAASTVALPQILGPSEAEPSEGNQLVRFEEPTTHDDFDADMMADDEGTLVPYRKDQIDGITSYGTPAPKTSKERRRSDKDGKKDKKRKRLHVDTEMTDAPVLHSGLTGGLNRMMSRPHAFPPSPDYSGSGGEVGETPASPLKKSKHSKHHKSNRQEGGIGNIMSILTSATTKTAKPKKRKQGSTSATTKKRHSSRQKRLEGAKEPKMIGYNDVSKDGEEEPKGSGAVVVFNRRTDLLFSMVNKGPESERGCSFNKVLKRYHRERATSGDSLPKPLEEKELFKSLRMRKNDRGEIVLFCV